MPERESSNRWRRAIGLTQGSGGPPTLDGGHAQRRVSGRRADPAAPLSGRGARLRGGQAGAVRPPPQRASSLLHCASLVHDDLPCFDDAATRRGRPSVHKAFGERIAVLTGDALIVLAFQALARAADSAPARLANLVGDHRARRRRAERHRRRPGLGMRRSKSPWRITSAPRPARCSRRPRRRAPAPRDTSGRLAPAGRAHRRGLSDRRRHSRRGVQRT
jgi:hypothetical protein